MVNSNLRSIFLIEKKEWGRWRFWFMLTAKFECSFFIDFSVFHSLSFLSWKCSIWVDNFKFFFLFDSRFIFILFILWIPFFHLLLMFSVVSSLSRLNLSHFSKIRICFSIIFFELLHLQFVLFTSNYRLFNERSPLLTPHWVPFYRNLLC